MVGIYKGSTQIKKIYKGSTMIKAVYKGSTKVWEIMANGTKVLNKTAAGSGSFTITVPGIYRLRVVGGGGGCATKWYSTGDPRRYKIGGGGGGGYATGRWKFAAGDVLTWQVGAGGGISSGGPGEAGGQSFIKKGSTTLVSANGATAPGYPENGDHSTGGTASVASSAISGSSTATAGGDGKTYEYKSSTVSSYTNTIGKSAYGNYGKGAAGYASTGSTIDVKTNSTAGCAIIEWSE